MSTPDTGRGGTGQGPRVAGGGDLAVDTDEQARAAHRLMVVADGLARLRHRASACSVPADRPRVRVHLDEAVQLLGRAASEAERAGRALHVAALRYGRAEHDAMLAQQEVWAASASLFGGFTAGLGLLGSAGPAVAGVLLLDTALLLATAETLRRAVETGQVQPQLDPVLVDALRLALASLDDAARGAVLRETGPDLARNDPRAFLGTETVAAVLAAALLAPAGRPIAVAPMTRRPTSRPRDLATLMRRIPQGEEPAGQVLIERYQESDGAHWIVYSAGTVTFAPDGGKEPFDLSSNVLGVGDRPTDAQRSILAAMAEAGVGRDEPVLFVGYSQGALNAVRLAEDGGYRAEGVVEFGGPTGQIALSPGVTRISVEHDEDLVPVLGGTAAGGAAGLRRVLVTRSLVRGGAKPGALPFTAGAAAHDRGAYAETMRRAEAAGDPKLLVARARLAGFLTGDDGTATRYRAVRVLPGSSESSSRAGGPAVSPARGRPAAAAGGPRASR